MKKLYSGTIGTIVFSDEYKAPISFVRDVLIDTDKGKIVAFVVNKKSKTVIIPLDIRAFSTFLHVSNPSVMIEAKDVVRLNDVLLNDIPVISNDVYTESGKYLGEVNDFVYETQTLQIEKIFVRKNFFGFFNIDKRIILAKDIIVINKDKIIVKDDDATVKVKEKAVENEKELAIA